MLLKKIIAGTFGVFEKSKRKEDSHRINRGIEVEEEAEIPRFKDRGQVYRIFTCQRGC